MRLNNNIFIHIEQQFIQDLGAPEAVAERAVSAADAVPPADALLGCGQMGSTLLGPLQKEWFLTDWGKRYALALLGSDGDGF